MAYPALAVANEFVAIANKSHCHDLTPIKLQKLVYFAHGWNLALTGKPLITERIQAWQYGPVIPELYREFKSSGNTPITQLATDLEWDCDNNQPEISTPRIQSDSADSSFTRGLVEKIWDVYGKYTPAKLVQATHEPDSPWTKAHINGQKNIVITDPEIEAYFKELMNDKS